MMRLGSWSNGEETKLSFLFGRSVSRHLKKLYLLLDEYLAPFKMWLLSQNSDELEAFLTQ